MTCTSCGVELTPENKATRRKLCIACNKVYNKEYYVKNRKRIAERKIHIPDDDDYSDLRPVSDNWWGDITSGGQFFMKKVFFILLLVSAFAVYAKPPDWKEPAAIRSILTEEGEKAGLPPGLSHCVAYTESRFIPTAKSEVVNGYRSCGLMQLYRKYLYGEKGFIARFSSKSQGDFRWDDPTDNAEAGCKYLACLITRFGGSQYLALVAYRWGETNLANIKKWDDIPEYARNYASGILKNLDEWEEGW